MKKPDLKRHFEDRTARPDRKAGLAGSGADTSKILFTDEKSGLSFCTSTTSSPVRFGNPDEPATGGIVLRLWNLFFNMRVPPQAATRVIPGLELMRGLACLQVFLSHIFVVLMLHSQTKVSPAWWKLAFLNWSYQSVMVFFVLSGYVIALSQKHKQLGFSMFMRARFRRLGPLYLVALLLSFGMEAVLYPPSSYSTLGVHLLCLQGSSLAPVFGSNAPLWSLSYEFYFYLIFAFLIGRRQKLLERIWFVLGLGAVGLNLAGITAPGLAGYFQNILAYSPVWLLGVFLADRSRYVGASMPQKLMLFGMLPLVTQAFSFLGNSTSPARSLLMGLCVAPLLFAAGQPPDCTPRKPRPLVWCVLLGLYATLVWSFLNCTRDLHMHTETIFAVIAPWLIMSLAPAYHLLLPGSPFSNERVTAASLWLGKMSYAIYIVHFPLLLAIGTIPLTPMMLVGSALILVIALAWLLTFHVEPLLTTGFDRLWPARQKPDVNLDVPRPLGADK